MDFKEIKAYIYQHELIPDLLEKLHCEGIKPEQGGSLYVARYLTSNESRNRRAVQVKNVKGLYSNIRNRDREWRYLQSSAASSSINGIKKGKTNILGRAQVGSKIHSILRRRKRLKRKLSQTTGSKRFSRCVLLGRMNVLLCFDHERIRLCTISRLDWWGDINSDAIQVRGSNGHRIERVVFPVHNSNGDLIGVKGRLLDKWMDDDGYKYLYLHPCNKSIEYSIFIVRSIARMRLESCT